MLVQTCFQACQQNGNPNLQLRCSLMDARKERATKLLASIQKPVKVESQVRSWSLNRERLTIRVTLLMKTAIQAGLSAQHRTI